MRSLSLISLLIALAIGAVLWQKLLVKAAPEPTLTPAEYVRIFEGENPAIEYPGDCEQHATRTPDCDIYIEPDIKSENEQENDGPETAEQGEMLQQRSNAHDTMMKSFDDKYDKYKDQVNGR